jgi:diguanylate cyclase (GGDEF)-like protein
MNFPTIFEKQGKPSYVLILVGFVLTGVIGIVDFLLGYEMSFSVFYVLPVAIVTWLTSRRFGLVTSLVGAFVWLAADLTSGHTYSHALIPIWNTFIRLAFFVIITLLLSALKKAAEREREFARVDNLTGAANPRLFYDLARMEIDRFRRYKHPFTLAYIDLDNFKAVNDRFGHPTGDHVLRIVASSARKFLRKTDVIARLGGDEFALLLPETNEESARIALSKIHDGLLEEMRIENWPITFSIGVLTCNVAPHTTEELVRMADKLMYSVKHDGKNSIKYSTYAG